jgi:hypothetical protein
MPSSTIHRRSPGASVRTRRPLKDQPASAGVMWTGSPSAVADPAGRNRSAATERPRGNVPDVRRSLVAGLVAAAITAAAVLAAEPGAPTLRFTDGTPRDLRAVAAQTWRRFTAAFPGRSDCLGAPTVGVAWELDDRARYEPGRALVLVRAPGTAGNLEASLLHEFAHHAEHRCPMGAAFRRGFVEAASLPAGTPWRGGERWDRIPSERFAEATVSFVLGGPPPHVLIPIHPEEIRAVAAWAAVD